MFNPTPDTTLQQLIDKMMREFSKAYVSCCTGEPRRVIIETDHTLPVEVQWDGSFYYMVDFTDNNGHQLIDETGNRVVTCFSCTDGSSHDAATYTDAVKHLEDIAQSEHHHITCVYVEGF